ncbi:branched-chain amino acid ABC transporter permease [Tessaracoccus sp. OS52]|uniref:branched-chain amino acid ABC transporter permease n=1 Tax=Tessaracoccus sp. OS52 TaxID=2886691 RepID=UPI001D114622|nr:branched-chain amino acid ABC transporter permease [Tessaracoccus sp. OS52]MCC2594015.1 branched-chain amino acid ABC transporter permease [Tessaracoccus sp. OS52]
MSRLKSMRTVITVAIAAVIAFLLPLFNIPGLGILPGPTWTPGSLQIMALALLTAGLALSYHLLFGVAGLLSFGHALYFGMGVYGLAILLDQTDLGLIPAALIVLAGGVVLTHILGAISLRVGGIAFAMVTLAFAHAANVLVRRNPGRLTGGDEGLSLNTTNIPEGLVGVLNTRNLYWLALVVMIFVYAVVAWIEHSRAGHVVAATRENETRVKVLGGNPFIVKFFTFVAAGVLAIIVGMAYLLLQSTASHTTTSADFTLTLLVMVVLGGVGSRWGAIVGAVIYTLLNQRLAALAGSQFISDLPVVLRIPLSEPMFILGTLFILVVILMPGGISGAVADLRRRTRRVEA